MLFDSSPSCISTVRKDKENISVVGKNFDTVFQQHKLKKMTFFLIWDRKNKFREFHNHLIVNVVQILAD